MILGYWGIQALNQPIRLLLAYLGQEYKEVTYKDFAEWQEDKVKLGLNFPNLPYLVDGEINLTESSAIPVYLCHKAGKNELLGKEGIDRSTHQQLVGVLKDLADLAWITIRAEIPEETLKIHRAKLDAKFAQIDKFLEGKQYLLGYFTYADILLKYYSDIYNKLAAALKTDTFTLNLKEISAHNERVSEIPEIKNFYENAPQAKFPIYVPSITKIKEMAE